MAVTDVNYADLWDVTAMASQGNGLSALGMGQEDLVAELTEFNANWNGVMTKLDSDGGVTLTTYLATYALALDPTTIGSLGLSQAIIVAFLDSYVAQFNLCMTALDGDSGTADSNYAATLAITDVINNDATFSATTGYNIAVDNRGMLQGALYSAMSTIVTNFNALNAKLDADA